MKIMKNRFAKKKKKSDVGKESNHHHARNSSIATSTSISSSNSSQHSFSQLHNDRRTNAIFDTIYYEQAKVLVQQDHHVAGLPQRTTHSDLVCGICGEGVEIYDDDTTDQRRRAAMLQDCSHKFHKGCLRSHLRKSCTCPVCDDDKFIGNPHPNTLLGRSPSGTMTVSETSTVILGITPPTFAYQIEYCFPDGTQQCYHPNPGERYVGFDKSMPRCAYLPRNDTGKGLLLRLQHSFSCGLLFVVGKSASMTHQHDRVCWSAKVPHKTSLVTGEFGFPDNNYFQHLSEMLDSIGVPSVHEIIADNNIAEYDYARRLVYGAASVRDFDVANGIELLIIDCTIPRIQRGKSPSGNFSCCMIPELCQGFSPTTMSLELIYTFPDAVQQSYHGNQGAIAEGTIRHAYLPDNDEGRNLLKRLMIAFRYGLTFDIGRSITQQRDNCIVWSGIPHMSSISDPSSCFSFPSPHYITMCNIELDQLHIPDASRCDHLSMTYFK